MPEPAPGPGVGGGRAIALARRYRVELALSVVAAAVYLTGIGWGMPYATDPQRIRTWAIDSISPLGPLTELYNTLVGSAGERWLAYPLAHYGLLSLSYGPYLLLLLLTGGFSSPQAQYPYGFTDPVGALQTLEVIARFVSIAMAAGIVVAAREIAKTLAGRLAGLLAGLMTMLLYPMVYYARTGNLDVPVLFWTSVGLVVYTRVVVHGLSTRRAAWLGIFAALATATKDQGYGAFVLMPPAMLLLHWRRPTGPMWPWRPLLAGLAAATITYAVTTGFVISPERHIAHIRWMAVNNPFAPEFTPVAPATLAGYATLARDVLRHVVDASGALLLLAAAAAVVLLTREETSKLAILAPALGHLLVVIAPVRLSMLRYAMPVALLVCVLAAIALARGLSASHPRMKWATVAYTGGILATLVVFAADLTYQMINDSRYAAARWLDGRIQRGGTVGFVGAASLLPRLEPGVEYVRIAPRAEAAADIQRGRADYIVIVPDWTSPKGVAHPGYLPVETYHRLRDGTLGYRLVATFKTPALVDRQILDYPTVNPLVTVFARAQD